MAKFKILEDTLRVMGDKKVGMAVVFQSDDGSREVANYHEVESTDAAEIERELQKAANEFEGRVTIKVADPSVSVGKLMSVSLEPAQEIASESAPIKG